MELHVIPHVEHLHQDADPASGKSEGVLVYEFMIMPKRDDLGRAILRNFRIT